MKDSKHDHIEAILCDLTDASPRTPSIAHRAIEELHHTDGPQQSRIRRLLRHRPAVAAVVACVTIFAIGIPIYIAHSPLSDRSSPIMFMKVPSQSDNSYPHRFAGGTADVSVHARTGPPSPLDASSQSSRTSPALSDFPAHRTIIRSGSITILSKDINDAARHVRSVIRPELGEYLGEVSISQSEYRPSASIILRIRAERLDSVIEQIGTIGETSQLNIQARDATDQILDLEARLRNERRMESELLDLLSARPDANLADILRIRTELSEFRTSIERLDAQRSLISELAALATLRVTIATPYENAHTPSDNSIGQMLAHSAQAGLNSLVRSFAWLIEALIGGLIWWIILAFLGLYLFRRLRWWLTWA
ncbi:MAG: DUF4349 domain-containing protein [Phycisphaeraceae bacterium]|nr:MAG: DUF4349 domain-containing protein [Phycisphaeraceae bacterium]